MAFGIQGITGVEYKELRKTRNLAGADYVLKGEISISTINMDDNVKQKLIIYYSDEIKDTISVPGLSSHRTFLQGRPYSEMKTDMKLIDQFNSKKGTMPKVTFGADICSIVHV